MTKTKEYEKIKLSINKTNCYVYIEVLVCIVAVAISAVALILVAYDSNTIASKYDVFVATEDAMESGQIALLRSSSDTFSSLLNIMELELNAVLGQTEGNASQLAGDFSALVDDLRTLVNKTSSLEVTLAQLIAYSNGSTLAPMIKVMTCSDSLVTLSAEDDDVLFVLDAQDCTIQVPMIVGLRVSFAAVSGLVDLSNTIQLIDGSFIGYIQSTNTQVFHIPTVSESRIVGPCGITPLTPGDYVDIEILTTSYANVNSETFNFGFDWGQNC